MCELECVCFEEFLVASLSNTQPPHSLYTTARLRPLLPTGYSTRGGVAIARPETPTQRSRSEMRSEIKPTMLHGAVLVRRKSRIYSVAVYGITASSPRCLA